jgi:hypothetical protein
MTFLSLFFLSLPCFHDYHPAIVRSLACVEENGTVEGLVRMHSKYGGDRDNGFHDVSSFSRLLLRYHNHYRHPYRLLYECCSTSIPPSILSISFTRRTLTNYLICTARRTKGELAHTHYSSLQLARHGRRSVQGLQRREGRFLSHRCAGFWPMGCDSDSIRSMNNRICMSASLLVFTIHIDSD